MPVVRAPARVNLIGDHTDYQAGLCLPMAINREVRVQYDARDDGRVVARSDGLPDEVTVAADGSADPATTEPRWGRTIAAVLRVIAARGRAPVGFDADVTSSVPIGSGLSSSAAFEVAIALAATQVAQLAISGRELAIAAQEAEHLATGMPCGVMDQMASVFGRAGHALLLDCRSLDVEPIALPPDVEVLVVHSGIARRLEESAYAERRAACEAAAARLGVSTLRDATFATVADDPFARHVVSENSRVLAFVDALRAHDLERCGALMRESHASLRDDFAVSTPELDTLVDLLEAEDTFGARLTGAGFGGCAIALTRVGSGDDLGSRVAPRYRAETGCTATPFVVHAVAGAGPVN